MDMRMVDIIVQSVRRGQGKMMKIIVRHYRGAGEVMAIEALLNWQCKGHLAEIEYEEDPRVLEVRKGVPGVVIIIEDKDKKEIYLNGYKELLNFFDKEGLWLL